MWEQFPHQASSILRTSNFDFFVVCVSLSCLTVVVVVAWWWLGGGHAVRLVLYRPRELVNTTARKMLRISLCGPKTKKGTPAFQKHDLKRNLTEVSFPLEIGTEL